MNTKCKVTFLLAAAEPFPGLKGQDELDSLFLGNVEDQRCWGLIYQNGLKGSFILDCETVLAGDASG